MAERFAAEIRVGGEIPADIVAELCEAIAHEGLALDWAESAFEPQSATDLLNGASDVEGARVLRLCDDEARWGCFPHLEMFLKRHSIAFDRLTEGGCGYDAERECFRPGADPLTVLTTVEGKPLVAHEHLTSLEVRLRQLQTASRLRDASRVESLAEEAIETLRRAVPTIPALPALRVSKAAAVG